MTEEIALNKKIASLPLADRRIPDGNDFLDPREVSSLTPDELIRRVTALKPLIASKAAISEQLRRTDDEVWAALRKSGIFYMLIPKMFGGIEADFETFIDVGIAVGEADVSTGWATTFCIEHNWLLASWPVLAQEELWLGEFPYFIASYTANPPGEAIKVEGGYRVSAHWKWGSGCMHADWVMGGVLLNQGPHEEPMPLSVIIPAGEVHVLDTWYMDGMAATGSNDIVVQDVFVPEHRAAPAITRGGGGGQKCHGNPMYSVPVLSFLAMTAVVPVLGGTRSIVETYRKKVSLQKRTYANGFSGDKPQVQDRLARAHLQSRTAELLVRDAARRMIVWATLPEEGQLAERIAIRAQISHAAKLCRETVMLVVEAAGSSVHAAGNPFNRTIRDIIHATTHLIFEYDITMEQHGRSLVGLEPNSVLV